MNHPAPAQALALAQAREYDDVYVPVVFHPWGCLLIGALAPEPDGAGLDVGTGPGTVARLLASCLGPKGSVVAVDTNSAMLALAQSKPAVHDSAPIDYQESDATCTEQPPATFDVITCQQILQFVADLPVTLTGLRRVCRPGAKLGIITWSGLEHNPLFHALHDAIAEVLGTPAATAFSQPWSLPATATRHAVEQAGFTNITSYPRTMPAVFDSGPTDVIRFYDFSACSTDIATLDDQHRNELHRSALAKLAPMTRHGKVHSTTNATVILARA